MSDFVMTLVPDCFLSILSDIDGSLRLRLRLGRLKLALVSCTTISVYVNVSKSKPPEGSASEFRPSQTRRSSLICGCKGTAFPETGKAFEVFFSKRMVIKALHIIY